MVLCALTSAKFMLAGTYQVSFQIPHCLFCVVSLRLHLRKIVLERTRALAELNEAYSCADSRAVLANFAGANSNRCIALFVMMKCQICCLSRW